MKPEANDLITLLQTLIACQSITPTDDHCQDIMIAYLESLGFRCQRFDTPPVSNFYAEYGSNGPLLVFAGHTDVVPVGDLSLWLTPPFELSDLNGMLYARGVADMKGSLAAMLIAAKRWIQTSADKNGRLGFLITSAEEGDHYDLGTPYVMSHLQQQGILPHYCIVGEPSSSHRVGDTIKIGRRGSLTCKVSLQGKQGHVAYPHLARNPIHMIAPLLAELSTIEWDQGNEHFPPTSLQITHVHSGGQASNIIPQTIIVHFNIRYSTEQSADSLKQKIEACFERHQLKADLEWSLSGEPFLTSTGVLLETCEHIIHQFTQHYPERSTSGGTSDGRFIAPYGVEVVELGPVNQSIHQINECVSKDDLLMLSNIYHAIMLKILNLSNT